MRERRHGLEAKLGEEYLVRLDSFTVYLGGGYCWEILQGEVKISLYANYLRYANPRGGKEIVITTAEEGQKLLRSYAEV
jgi:hypothetical protein